MAATILVHYYGMFTPIRQIITPDQQITLVSRNPKLLRYIDNPCEATQIFVILMDKSNIDLIDNPTPTVQQMMMEYLDATYDEN